MSGYLWVYQYRLWDIPWSSTAAWWAGFLAADFAYYWFHRVSHEVSLIWSWHQVHHSHEDYNVTVALRQSMFQRLFSLGFYHPMALLGVPLPAVCVHWHLNLLVQFVIHTDLVDKLGPLEWILNTPSHHRVHHGANRYCLDKNYGGFLIIWDKLFGTFEAEREDDPVVYGLVDQPQTSNVLYLQFFYIRDILEKARTQTTWGDSLRAIFYGPGWSPGSPRLGDLETFPDVKAPRAKYDPQLHLWQKSYTGAHYLVLLLIQQMFTFHLKSFSTAGSIGIFLFILVSISNLTAMYDRWRWVGVVEVLRCLTFCTYAQVHPVTGVPLLDLALLAAFYFSMVLWTILILVSPHKEVKFMKMS